MLHGVMRWVLLLALAFKSNSFKALGAGQLHTKQKKKTDIFLTGTQWREQLCKFFCKIAWKKLKIIYAVCSLKLSIALRQTPPTTARRSPPTTHRLLKSIQSCQCPLAACACMQKSTLLP